MQEQAADLFEQLTVICGLKGTIRLKGPQHTFRLIRAKMEKDQGLPDVFPDRRVGSVVLCRRLRT